MLKGRDQPEDLEVDEKKILRRMLGEQSGRLWVGFTWLRRGTGGGLL
jgi:hypothetical protein